MTRQHASVQVLVEPTLAAYLAKKHRQLVLLDVSTCRS